MSELPESDRLEGWPHPREARRVFGHEAAEATLLKAVNGQMPHAWVFGGLKGIGKATLAWRLAKALLQRGRSRAALETLDSDPSHPAVRRLMAGAQADVLSLRRPADPKTGKIKNDLTVDEVRRLGEFYARHAGEGGIRIAIVDSADNLNRNAANALLKTLEEPPPDSLLILIAHRPRALLPTIRSRCRMLTLSPLSDDELSTALGAVAPDMEQSTALVRMAAGSVGGALELAAHDGPGLDAALRTIAARRGRDANAAHALANELAAAAAAPRFRLFLDRLQAGFAEGARLGDREALEAWKMTGDLARAEDGLNIDKRSIVLRLLERYAALAA
ncbi:MAG: DNA polymerase III subunit delta' [Micropepsaceae bacterium]